MKTCPFCKEQVHEEAIKCRFCQSMLLPVQSSDQKQLDGHRVTYILDRDLVRFGKFAGAVLAIFLVVGAYLFGFKLESALDKARNTQEELKITQEKLTVAQRELEAAQATVKGLKRDVETVLEDANSLVSEIRGSREEARTLLADFGRPPAPSAGLGPEQAQRLIEIKLLKSFRNVLTGDQYAKLEREFMSAAATELRRAIYDAGNLQSLPGKLVRSEGQATTDDPVVTQVYDNIGTVHKFFDSAFGRNISSDVGGTISATVHFGRNYNNAFSDGRRLVVGDGDGIIFKSKSFGSLSIVAAELSHPVINASVRLAYMGESGAIHTHFTDVFAALTEQWQKKQTADKASWLIGADILAPGVKGVGLRSMKAPGTAYDDPRVGKDRQPDHISKYVKTTEDNGGVHINSGIPNRAFYEVAKAIGGNAWERAGKIWYESMLNLKENSTFNDFALTTYEVAGKLYGEGSPERQAVRKGWEAVGIAVVKGKNPS